MKEFIIEIDSDGKATTSDPDAPLKIEHVRDLQEALAAVDAEDAESQDVN